MADWGGFKALNPQPRDVTKAILIKDCRTDDEDIAVQLRAAFHDVRIEDLKPISPAIQRDWLRVAQRARGLF